MTVTVINTLTYWDYVEYALFVAIGLLWLTVLFLEGLDRVRESLGDL